MGKRALVIALVPLLAACASQTTAGEPTRAAAQAGSDLGRAEEESRPPSGATPSPAAVVSVAPASTPSDFRVSTLGWRTDFSKRSVPPAQIMSGGPPRDGIPPLDAPKFVSSAEA